MNKQLTILLLSGALFAGSKSFAQEKVEVTTTDAGSSYAMQKMQDSVFERPFFLRPSAIALNLGTQGFGLDYTIRATHHWFFRFGVDMIPINYPTKLKIDGYSSDLKLNANVVNLHLLAEWQPFYRSGFRIVGGAAYFASAQVKGSLQPNGDYKYGDIDVTGQEIGALNATIDWKGIAPYLGLGFGKGIPKKKFNFTVDLGTYYLAQPVAHVTGTNLLAGNSTNDAQLNQNLKDYRWLPVLQFNFSYRLIK